MNKINVELQEKGIKQTWLAEKLCKSFNLVIVFRNYLNIISHSIPLRNCRFTCGGCEGFVGVK